MAPTETNNHLKDDAGLHSLAPKSRGRKHVLPEHNRRYVDVPEMIPESTPLKSSQSEKTFRSSKSMSPRRGALDDAGMSSCELSKSHELGRGRRHISYASSRVEAMRTPSTPSEASEMMSEASADFHLGPRSKFKDERWKALLEAERESVGYDFEDEQVSGATSHHLSRKGKLGAGRKKCKEFEWAGGHDKYAANDPGGPTIFEDTAANPGSFLGACRRRCDGMSKSQEQSIDLVGSKPPPEPIKRGKKIFQDHYEEPPAASPEIPVGVSQQIDLHTKGFLGKRRGGEGKGKAQISMGPIEDRSKEPRDIYDLTCYGLHHRGKRKFLVQNNLDTSCRHDMSRAAMKTAPTLTASASAPILEADLPKNQTPYYQDNLEERKRAVKDELKPACRSGIEVDRKMPPRNCNVDVDNTWSSMTWTQRKADMETASSFIEGEDMSPRRYQKTSARFIEGQNLIHDIPDNDHHDNEMRLSHGPSKRSFGNAHNKSSFRHNYNDNSDHKEEMHRNDGHRWGPGHGRKRFDVADHLYEAEDGIQPYMSSGGFPLGKAKPGQHKPEADLMGPFSPGKASEKDLYSYMGPDGKMHHNRPAKQVKDNVNDIIEYEKSLCESDTSNTLGVSGTRRTGEMIRPQSARRFPQRDFERTEPKSVRPRTPDPYANKPITARPLWKKGTNIH